jgi:hypothetical protein
MDQNKQFRDRLIHTAPIDFGKSTKVMQGKEDSFSTKGDGMIVLYMQKQPLIHTCSMYKK